MRIAFLLDRFPQNGGVENITLKLANEFVRIGYDVTIISQVGDKLEMLSDLSPKIKFVGIEDRNFTCKYICEVLRLNATQLLINQGAYPKTNRIVEKIKEKSQVQVISVLHNEPAYLYKAAKASMQDGSWKAIIKCVIAPIYLSRMRRYVKADFRRMACFSEAIVLLSDSYISEFTQWIDNHNPDFKDKLCAIPNPVENVSCIGTKKNNILYVGRLEEGQKKLSRFLKIWAKIAWRYKDWTFDIVGDGKDKALYEAYVNRNGIERVIFHGFHKNASQFYSESSLLILTSQYEGLPLVLLEGMVNGCVPVVYDTFKSAQDIIKSGENGFLITPFDEDEFIDKMEDIMNKPDLLKEMSQSARRIIDKYSYPQIMNRWINLIDNI